MCRDQRRVQQDCLSNYKRVASEPAENKLQQKDTSKYLRCVGRSQFF
jgi:hypothetical protein